MTEEREVVIEVAWPITAPIGKKIGRKEQKDIVGRSIGQSVVAYVFRDLFGLSSVPIHEITEITPPELRSVRVGEMTFKRVAVDIFLAHHHWSNRPDLHSLQGLEILAEVHGSQHYDDKHYFHRFQRTGVKNAKDSFARMEASTHAKHLYATSDPTHRRFVVIPYPDEDRHDLRMLVERALQELEKQVPEILSVVDYACRKANVTSPSWMESCLTSRYKERIAAATDLLTRFQRPDIDLHAYDIATDTFQFHCTAHVPPHQLNSTSWNNFRNNAFGCQLCKHKANGERRRLRFDDLVQRANDLGFKPEFEQDTYKANSQTLIWRCEAAGHLFPQRFTRLGEGCGICKKEVFESARLATLRKDVVAQVASKDAYVVSALSEIMNWDSKIEVKCNRCGETSYKRVAKIIQCNQGCKCSQNQAATLVKKNRADVRMREILAYLGWDLLEMTHAENAKHRDSVLRLQLPDGSEKVEKLSALVQRQDYRAASTRLFGLQPRRPRGNPSGVEG